MIDADSMDEYYDMQPRPDEPVSLLAACIAFWLLTHVR